MKFRHLLTVGTESLLPGLVTVAFVVFFLVLFWFVYRRERNAVYEKIERLPLEENGK